MTRETAVDYSDLPKRFVSLTPCFRSEAGAAGKDTRGIMRQHQFYKVELVSLTSEEKSNQEHERMLSCAEEVLKRLDLHYRVVVLSSQDMGFAARKPTILKYGCQVKKHTVKFQVAQIVVTFKQDE